jgi:hypothetical protein
MFAAEVRQPLNRESAVPRRRTSSRNLAPVPHLEGRSIARSAVQRASSSRSGQGRLGVDDHGRLPQMVPVGWMKPGR